MKGLIGNILLENDNLVKVRIDIDKGKIVNINRDFTNTKNHLFIDEDKIIVSGFIDVHVHGANNSDVMYATYDDLMNISLTLAKEGVSSYLATTMTQSIENINKALINIKDYINLNIKAGARVLGVHLEGPFINKKYKGAQNDKYIIPCDVELFKKFETISDNNISKVTLAYEENGRELVEYLQLKNIIASIGHSDANCSLVLEGISKGICCCTHFYNAMKPLHHREAGVVGAILISDDVDVELICDLIHVSKEAIKVVYKNKGSDKIILITDGIEAKHLGNGKYSLGGLEVFVENGVARLVDGTLAGSTLKLNEGIRNIKETLNISLFEAVKMATNNPANSLKIDRGFIEKGMYADFAIIDKDVNVYKTIREGVIIYEKV